nr:unnamed protein product [Callosobruchus analis]
MDKLSTALKVLDDYNCTENIICKDLSEPATYIKDQFENLTFLHYNIRSLKAYFDEVCLNIDKLNEKTVISIIILSETWNMDDISHYKIKGYLGYCNGVTYNKCDGVVVYVKNNFAPKINTISLTEISMVECCLKVEIKINIIGMYRPTPTNKQIFIYDLND